jgi:hypothetical protein
MIVIEVLNHVDTTSFIGPQLIVTVTPKKSRYLRAYLASNIKDALPYLGQLIGKQPSIKAPPANQANQLIQYIHQRPPKYQLIDC